MLFTEKPVGPLSATLIQNSNVELTWSPSRAEGGSPILAYFVEKCLSGTSQWSEVEKTDPGVHRVVISDLLPGQSYQFRVYAENQYGQSEYLEMDGEIQIPVGMSYGG